MVTGTVTSFPSRTTTRSIGVAGLMGLHLSCEIAAILNRGAVDGDDQVTNLETGLVGTGARSDFVDQGAALTRLDHAEGNPEVRGLDLLTGHETLGNAVCDVDRHCEADTVVGAGQAEDRDIDPDHAGPDGRRAGHLSCPD